ncbi:response regulator [candidate division GN15 bacterium]|nr:response regulator [candidate division GN15 bacterium]
MRDSQQQNDATRVMVVDDDDAVRELIRAIMTKDGYKVATARTGAEAVRQADRFHPDLIIMDITMPEMDGYEATSRIRRNPRLKEVPIVFLTGKTVAEDAGRSFATGGSVFVRKPFSAKQIRDLVRLTLASAPHA